MSCLVIDWLGDQLGLPDERTPGRSSAAAGSSASGRSTCTSAISRQISSTYPQFPRTWALAGTITQSRSAAPSQPVECGPLATARGRDGPGDGVGGEAERDGRREDHGQPAPRAQPDHQRQQDQAVEEVAGIGRAAQQPVVDDHEHQGAGGRAGDAACAAEDEPGVDQDQDRRVEVGREHADLLRGEDGAGQRGDHGAEHERHQLHPVDRDRHRRRRQRVLRDGAPGPPGARVSSSRSTAIVTTQHDHRAGSSSPCWW